jgi:hypothetical protein
VDNKQNDKQQRQTGYSKVEPLPLNPLTPLAIAEDRTLLAVGNCGCVCDVNNGALVPAGSVDDAGGNTLPNDSKAAVGLNIGSLLFAAPKRIQVSEWNEQHPMNQIVLLLVFAKTSTR